MKKRLWIFPVFVLIFLNQTVQAQAWWWGHHDRGYGEHARSHWGHQRTRALYYSPGVRVPSPAHTQPITYYLRADFGTYYKAAAQSLCGLVHNAARCAVPVLVLQKLSFASLSSTLPNMSSLSLSLSLSLLSLYHLPSVIQRTSLSY